MVWAYGSSLVTTDNTIVAINWEKFCVKILSLVQPTTNIKLTKIFDDGNFWYKNNVWDVHTKTAVLKALLLTWFTAGTHSRCQFEATSSWRVIFQILKDRCQYVCQLTQAIVLHTRRWRLSWKKALVKSAVSTADFLQHVTSNILPDWTPQQSSWMYCQPH